MRNRTSTRDLDYFLHPSTPLLVSEGLKAAISRVCVQLDYDSSWCNDEILAFVNLLRRPEELFDQSLRQGLVLYSSKNLEVYAAHWMWSLVRKMKRLQMSVLPPRMVDFTDCVDISRIIYQEQGMIGKDMLEQFDHSEREPPVFLSTAQSIGSMCARTWGSFPFNLEGVTED